VSHTKSDDVLASMRRLAERVLEDPVRIAKRATEGVQRVASGKVDSRAVGRAGTFLASEPMQYVVDAAGVALDAAHSVLELNLQYQERFYDRVFGVRSATIAIRARRGEHIERNVAVDNAFDTPLTIAASAEPLHPEGGGGEPLGVEVSPSEIDLDPESSGEVTLRFYVDPEVALLGRRYIGELTLDDGNGHGKRIVIIELDVDPAD